MLAAYTIVISCNRGITSAPTFGRFSIRSRNVYTIPFVCGPLLNLYPLDLTAAMGSAQAIEGRPTNASLGLHKKGLWAVHRKTERADG